MLIVLCCVLINVLCLTAIILRLRQLESMGLRQFVKRENQLAEVRLKVLAQRASPPVDVDIHWELHPMLKGV